MVSHSSPRSKGSSQSNAKTASSQDDDTAGKPLEIKENKANKNNKTQTKLDPPGQLLMNLNKKGKVEHEWITIRSIDHELEKPLNKMDK